MVKKHRRVVHAATGTHKKDAAVRRELRKGKRGTGAHHTDKEVADFNSQLAVEGLIVHPIMGDGNCLFRAISHQVYGTEDRHYDVRTTCVAEMERHPDDFAPFLLDEDEGWEGPDAFADYCKAMRTPGEWGGNLEVVAAGRALCRHIVIHRLSEPRWEVVAVGVPEGSATIHVSYHNANHYASVVALAAAAAAAAGRGLPAGAGTPQLHVAPVEAVDKKARGAAAVAAAAAAAEAYERVAIVCEMMWPERAGDSRAQAAAAAALAESGNDVESAVELLLAGWRPEKSKGGAAASVDAAGATSGDGAGVPSAVACPRAAAAMSRPPDPAAPPRRNGPCPCGRGLVYRRCCMATDVAARNRERAMAAAAAEAAEAASHAASTVVPASRKGAAAAAEGGGDASEAAVASSMAAVRI